MVRWRNAARVATVLLVMALPQTGVAEDRVQATAGGGSGPYPADPFAGTYAPPVAREVGVAAGQMRLSAGLGNLGFSGLHLIGRAGMEVMTFAFLGVRMGTVLTLYESGEAPPASWSFRAGPSLHFLPYRRLDLGIYLEAGPTLLAPFGDDSQWIPTLAPGLTADVSLSSYWYVQLDGHLVWGVYADRGIARDLVDAVGLLHLGVQL